MNNIFYKVWHNKYISSIIFYYLNLYKAYRNCYIADLKDLKTYQWKDYVNKIIFTNQQCVKIKKCYFSNRENIRSIKLYYSNNLEIEENSIPESITDLFIGNLLINEKTTPPMDIIKSLNRIYSYCNLNSLAIHSEERKINIIMNESNQFENLTNLNLNFHCCDTLIISKLSFPKNLKSLTFQYHRMNCELNEDMIPSSLTFLKIINYNTLKIKSLYNTNIKDIIIKHGLKSRLARSSSILPKNIDKLYIGAKSRDICSYVLKDYIPEGIRVFSTRGCPLLVLPNSLKYLQCWYHENFPIINNHIMFGIKSIFPKNLKYLRINGLYFNQPLKLLPSSLTHLEITGSSFNQSLDYDGCLPFNLISLTLSYYYFIGLKISNEIISKVNIKSLKFTHCPKSLNNIKFICGYKLNNCQIITFSELQGFINNYYFLSIDKLKELQFLQVGNLIYYN